MLPPYEELSSLLTWPDYLAAGGFALALLLFAATALLSARSRLPAAVPLVLALVCAGTGVLASRRLAAVQETWNRFQASLRYAAAMVGAPLPDFQFHSVAGGSARRLSQLKGKVVLLHFWHPERGNTAAAELSRLRRRLGARGVEVVHLVGLPAREAAAACAQRAVEGIDAQVDTLSGLPATYGDLQVIFPTTLILDRAGRLRSLFTGNQSESAYAAGLQSLL